jgi:phage protein D
MAMVTSGLECYVPAFTVELVDKGMKIPKDSLTAIDIDEDLENPAMFTLSFNESIDLNTQKFRWLDSEAVTPGTEVLISFGYASSKSQGSMRGKIKAVTPGFLSSGIPSLSVEGYDLSHDLQKTQGKMSYSKVSYSQIAAEIAGDNGLNQAGIASTRIIHPKVERKKNEKDYTFLKRLAEEIGFEVFMRDKTLYFREPQDTQKGAVDFVFRNNIISFNPRLSTAALANEVEVTAWDEKGKETISETASISELKSAAGIPNFDSLVEKSQGKKVKVRLEGKVIRSREEAKAIALSELKRRNKGFIEGKLECTGNPQLSPGMTINVDKIGKLFSGIYYVTKAKHTLGDGGYKTTLDVRRSVF